MSETDQVQAATTEMIQQEASQSVLDKIIKENGIGRDPDQAKQSKKEIETLLRGVLDGTLLVSEDLVASVNARIAAIDELLSKQLNEVMHASEFQKIEAAWRGLHYLVQKSETSTMLKLKVLNASKEELRRDLERAPAFDGSTLFTKVYEEEYGTPGGVPYGALIGDYEFGRHPQDVVMLEKISQVAAAAHSPFFAAANPEVFNLDSFTEIGAPPDLARIFDGLEYTRWRSFREKEDSRYVGLALPHILMRLPYGQATAPVAEFNFEEDVDGKNHRKYLWGNAAYALGTRLTEAFAKHSWCAAIRGYSNGGRVQDLPAHTFQTDEGDVALKCPTEIAISDRREKELAELGFVALQHYKGTPDAVFMSVQSCQKARKFDADAANANARLSTQLPYIMAVSRFAHYLKVMMRDRIGDFMSRTDCERFLNRWITNYVTPMDDADPTVKAEKPLRDARIDVVEVPGKPGAYRAVAYLRPHFQLDELTVSLRLVAELPPRAQR